MVNDTFRSTFAAVEALAASVLLIYAFTVIASAFNAITKGVVDGTWD